MSDTKKKSDTTLAIRGVAAILSAEIDMDFAQALYNGDFDLKKEDHACSTGDCDHEKQTECDETLAKDYNGSEAGG